MKTIVYILTKHETIKNYVSEINVIDVGEDEPEVGLEFSLDINQALDLGENAPFICDVLTDQIGKAYVEEREE